MTIDTNFPMINGPFKDTCESATHDIFSQLYYCYETSLETGDFPIFLNAFFDELDRDESITPESIIREFNARSDDDYNRTKQARLTTAVRMSLYYCYVSILNYENGEIDEFWRNTINAGKWLGVSYGANHHLYVFGAELSELARKNAKKRSAKYDPLRDYARAEAGKKNYRSKRNAALSIKDSVLTLARELGIGLSEPQAEKTISGWLDGLTFASKRLR